MWHYNMLCLSSKKLFPVLYGQYCDEIDVLQHRVIGYHGNLLGISLLHDAESHDWQDTKEFFEV